MTSNANLLLRRQAAIPRGVSSATPVFAASAKDCEIHDVEGRRYVDFAGGIAVLNVGHQHPKVMAAAREQFERFTHTAFQVMAYEPYVALAERLNALAPFSGAAKTIFFTTGAEATENAVKIARAATGRSAIISFTGAFHGRTLLAAAMTGKMIPYKRAFAPLPPEIYHLPFPSERLGVSVDDTMSALGHLFSATVDPARVAAIIIEPVQGEGGFHVAPRELLVHLRRICDENGILLVVDEVQTGFARTGRMFAIEHSGVEPDLVAVAKSLAAGFPLSGVIGRAHILDTIEPGGLGGTYGGSPIACAAALAVLQVIAEEQLCARADAIGARVRERVMQFGTRNDLVPITGPRGLGGMIAFDVVQQDGFGAPDGAAAKAVCTRALAEGLLILNAGGKGETIRVLVPLTATDAIIDEGLDCLEVALRRPDVS